MPLPQRGAQFHFGALASGREERVRAGGRGCSCPAALLGAAVLAWLRPDASACGWAEALRRALTGAGGEVPERLRPKASCLAGCLVAGARTARDGGALERSAEQDLKRPVASRAGSARAPVLPCA